MSKNYQKNASKDTAGTVVSVPAAVSVALADLSGQVQEGRLALAVATGLQVMTAMMDADVDALAGPKVAMMGSAQRSGTGRAPGR